MWANVLGTEEHDLREYEVYGCAEGVAQFEALRFRQGRYDLDVATLGRRSSGRDGGAADLF